MNKETQVALPEVSNSSLYSPAITKIDNPLGSEYNNKAFIHITQAETDYVIQELDLLIALSTPQSFNFIDRDKNTAYIQVTISDRCVLEFRSGNGKTAIDYLLDFLNHTLSLLTQADFQDDNAKQYQAGIATFWENYYEEINASSGILGRVRNKLTILSNKYPYLKFLKRTKELDTFSSYRQQLSELKDPNLFIDLSYELLQRHNEHHRKKRDIRIRRKQDFSLETQPTKQLIPYTTAEWQYGYNHKEQSITTKTEIPLPESRRLEIRGTGHYKIVFSSDVTPGMMQIEHGYHSYVDPHTNQPPFESMALVLQKTNDCLQLHLEDEQGVTAWTVIQIGELSYEELRKTPFHFDIQTTKGDIILEKLAYVQSVYLKTPQDIRISGDIGFREATISNNGETVIERVGDVVLTQEVGTPYKLHLDQTQNVLFKGDHWDFGQALPRPKQDARSPHQANQLESSLRDKERYQWHITTGGRISFEPENEFNQGVIVEGNIWFESINNLDARNVIFLGMTHLKRITDFVIDRAQTLLFNNAKGTINGSAATDVLTPYELYQRQRESIKPKTVYIDEGLYDTHYSRKTFSQLREVPVKSTYVAGDRWEEIEAGRAYGDNT